ncbi:MAG TPA: AAA family ATPase [Candidatus Angelobacter sp.]
MALTAQDVQNTQNKVKHSVLPLAEIIKRRGTGKRASYLVEGIIAEKSVNIGVGDSGIGKSPLAYQMGLCVASGKPFLGRAVKQGRVIYADLENGEDQLSDIALALARHLELPEIPPEFHLLVDRDDCSRLGGIIAEMRPALVIIDSLRAFRPDAEEKSRTATTLLNMLRELAREFATSILLLHHIRKSVDDENVAPIDSTNVMDWLTVACGSRSLINQTDTRIAFGPCPTQKTNKKKGQEEDTPESLLRDSVGLVMRWAERSRGQSAPLYLSRVMDADGEPLGYQAMTGPELLFNDRMKEFWYELPRDREFTFTEAKEIYQRAAPATKNWLAKCMAVGIVHQLGKGLPYRVIEPAG